jgi:hypothetical protein
MRLTTPCYFGFDSLARVCFLSLSGAQGFTVPAQPRAMVVEMRQAKKR